MLPPLTVPFTTVAERLKPESLYDRFLEFRASLGMEVLPLTGGEHTDIEVVQRSGTTVVAELRHKGEPPSVKCNHVERVTTETKAARWRSGDLRAPT